jgi:hypothetical protein
VLGRALGEATEGEANQNGACDHGAGVAAAKITHRIEQFVGSLVGDRVGQVFQPVGGLFDEAAGEGLIVLGEFVAGLADGAGEGNQGLAGGLLAVLEGIFGLSCTEAAT